MKRIEDVLVPGMAFVLLQNYQKSIFRLN